MCHQKPSEIEYPLAPLGQLSPKDVNLGIKGMMCAIGVSHTMFDLLVHCLVDIVLKLCVMNQMGSRLHCGDYMFYLVLC